MANKGLSLMGTGVSSGDDRAVKAAKEAISSPLLEDVSIEGATGIIINISGNESLTMHETNEAVTLIMEAADEDAEIIFGTVIDEKLEDQVKVTVIATGLGGMDRVTTRSIIESTEKLQEQTESTDEDERSPEIEEPVLLVNEELEKEELSIEESTQAVIQEDQKVLHDGLDKIAEETRQRVERVRDDAREEERERPTPGRDRIEPNRPANRAKTIAEKLGFVSYDEEELDTPTYIRMSNRDEETTNNLN
jgi:cell division protein FtsZ